MIEYIQQPSLGLRDAIAFLDWRRGMYMDRIGCGEIRFETLSAHNIRPPDGWVLRPLEDGNNDRFILGLRFGGERRVLPTVHAWKQILHAIKLREADFWRIRAQEGDDGLMSDLDARMKKIGTGGITFRMLKMPDSPLVLRAFFPKPFSTGMDNLPLCHALAKVGAVHVPTLRCFLDSGDKMLVEGDVARRSDERRAFRFSLQASEVGHYKDIVIDVLAPQSKHRTLISYERTVPGGERELLSLVGNAVEGGMENILNAVQGRHAGDEIVNITIKRKGVDER